MAAITHAAPARGRRRPVLGGWLAAIGDWRRARTAEAELRRLDEHMLADLGLERSDIIDAVRHGRR